MAPLGEAITAWMAGLDPRLSGDLDIRHLSVMVKNLITRLPRP
jgi:hypothetical protein